MRSPRLDRNVSIIFAQLCPIRTKLQKCHFRSATVLKRRACSCRPSARCGGSGLAWLLVFLDFDGSADLDGGAETLVIGVAHSHMNAHGAAAEAEHVIVTR